MQARNILAFVLLFCCWQPLFGQQVQYGPLATTPTMALFAKGHLCNNKYVYKRYCQPSKLNIEPTGVTADRFAVYKTVEEMVNPSSPFFLDYFDTKTLALEKSVPVTMGYGLSKHYVPLVAFTKDKPLCITMSPKMKELGWSFFSVRSIEPDGAVAHDSTLLFSFDTKFKDKIKDLEVGFANDVKMAYAGRMMKESSKFFIYEYDAVNLTDLKTTHATIDLGNIDPKTYYQDLIFLKSHPFLIVSTNGQNVTLANLHEGAKLDRDTVALPQKPDHHIVNLAVIKADQSDNVIYLAIVYASTINEDMEISIFDYHLKGEELTLDNERSLKIPLADPKKATLWHNLGFGVDNIPLIRPHSSWKTKEGLFTAWNFSGQSTVFGGTSPTFITFMKGQELTYKYAIGLGSIGSIPDTYLGGINMSGQSDKVSILVDKIGKPLKKFEAPVDPLYIHTSTYGCGITFSVADSGIVAFAANAECNTEGCLIQMEKYKKEALMSNAAGMISNVNKKGKILKPLRFLHQKEELKVIPSTTINLPDGKRVLIAQGKKVMQLVKF